MHFSHAVERFEELVERVGGDEIDPQGLLEGEFSTLAKRHAEQALGLIAGDEQDLAYRYVRAALEVAELHLQGELFDAHGVFIDEGGDEPDES